MDIVLFGDSYTDGRLPHTQTDGALADALGLPRHLRLARSGSTAQQRALDTDNLLSRVCGTEADVAVGSLGGNDAFAALADGVVTPLETVAALAALYYALRKIAVSKPRVLLMLYPDPYQGARPDAEGRLRLVQAIAAVAAEVNRATGNVETLDLAGALGPRHFDGVDIHPNAAGYAAMAAVIRARLRL